MIEKYEELNRVYEKYQHLYSHEYDNEYEAALNVLLETIGSMINECEDIFDDMAESYSVVKESIDE